MAGKGPAFVTGFEIAVGVALGYFTGMWLGKRYGWEPWASLTGAALGFLAGAYLMIKEMNRADQAERQQKLRDAYPNTTDPNTTKLGTTDPADPKDRRP
jgi:F0F1-type ATP synthase assembly protein I